MSELNQLNHPVRINEMESHGQHHGPNPSVSSSGTSLGTGVIRGTYMFDFDAGIETAGRDAADVWWEQQTATARRMTPLNGATLCPMGIVAYEPLGLSDLLNLPYGMNPIAGNVSGTNFLVDGSVFAVHTRTGKYAKVQVQQYGYDLQIRWEICTSPLRYLTTKVTIGSAPDWLVTRYAVECTYQTPNGTRQCGNGLFDPSGGIVEGQVSNEGGAFPSSILVTVTVDFEPETKLQGLVKSFTPAVTDTGVNFLFEPYQVIQRTQILFDLRPPPIATDYLLLRWKHIAGGNVVASGQKYLSGKELRQQPVTQYEIVFVPDPIYAKDVDLEIEGRYRDKVLGLFAQKFELSETAIIIRAQRAATGQGFVLVAA